MAQNVYNLSFLDDDYQPQEIGEKLSKFLPGRYIWSLFPEDKIPNVLKQGYNHSIEGLAHKALTGKNFYDLGNYSPGILSDIASTMISFVASPTDYLTLGLGGAVAKTAAKPLLGRTTNALVKGGMPRTEAIKSAQLGMEQLLQKSAPISLRNEFKKGGLSQKVLSEFGKVNKAGSIGSIGFYSGLQSALIQEAEEGEVSLAKSLYDGTKAGLTLYGGMVGGKALSSAMTKGKFGKHISELMNETTPQAKLARLSATKGVEIASFGTAPAVFETIEGNPRFPHPAEYAHALGVVGGLTVARGAVKLASGQPAKQRVTKLKKEDIALEEKGIKGTLTKEAEMAAREQVGRKIDIQEDFKFFRTDGTTIVEAARIRDKKLNDIIKITLRKSENPQIQKDIDIANKNNLPYQIKISKQDYINKYKNISDDRSIPANASINQISKINFKEAKKLSKEQGVSDKEFDIRYKQIKDRSPETLDVEINRRIRRFYEAEKEIPKIVQSLKKDPKFVQDVANVEYGTTFSRILGKNLYNKFMDFAGPAEASVKSPIGKKAFDVLDNFQYQNRIQINKYLGPGGLLDKAGYNTKTPSKEKKLLGQVLSKEININNLKKGQTFVMDGKNYKFNVIDPSRVRKTFNIAYRDAVNAKIDVAKFEPNYFPRYYKSDVLRQLRIDIDNIARKAQKQGYEANEIFNKNENTTLKKEFNNFIKKEIKEGNYSKDFRKLIYQYANVDALGRPKKTPPGVKFNFKSNFVQGFTKLREDTGSSIFDRNNNYSLTKNRLKENKVPQELLEINTDAFLSRYFTSVAKSISHSKNFGQDGAYLKGIGSALNALANDPRSKVTIKDFKNFEQIVKMTTGAIEFDPKFNWSQGTKSFLQDVTSFQVGTKIGLGFAVIPNLSQLSISVALKTGYGPLINAALNYKTKAEYKKFVNSVAYNYKDIMDASIGTSLEGSTLAGKFANLTTNRFFGLPIIGKALSFNRINEINFKMSAVTSYEYLLKQQSIAQGKGALGKLQSQRTKAKMELKKAGFDDFNTNLSLKDPKSKTYDKLQKYAFTFARDFQLQKNVLRDPKFANDPRFRPFFLFKRFGYRQADLFSKVLREEGKNPAMYLRLAASGLFGLGLVMPAKELLSRFLAGEEIYDPKYNLNNTVLDIKQDGSISEAISQYSLNDVIDGIASVGAIGTVSDILAGESFLESVEFALKPVIFADLDKAYDATSRFFTDINGYGIGGAFKRTPKNLAPIFGTGVRRVTQRFATEKQEEDYVKYRKGLVRGQILDALAVGDNKTSIRLLNEWNRVYGFQNPIMYEDVDYDDVAKRIITKAEKRRRP